MTENLLIQMPTDQELFEAFVDAIRNWVHENIKGIAGKLSWFLENAKDDIKLLLSLDQTMGLALNINVESWDAILAWFVWKQWRVMRNTLKLLLSTVHASTFTSFVNKMKENPEDIDVTLNTLSKIMTIFFANLWKKYLVQENENSVREKIENLFK